MPTLGALAAGPDRFDALPHRLVTVRGRAGSGKTWPAAEVAQQAAGELDSLLAAGTCCLRLAGIEIGFAARRERLDQQPLAAEPASELKRLFRQLPGRVGARSASGLDGGDQCRTEQPGICLGAAPA